MNHKLEERLLRPIIIGHRGFRAAFPENTMIGFRAALDAGADMLELDVRLSRDKHLIVIHDAGLDRTTDRIGLVSEYTLDQLKSADAGIRFHPRFSGERLPVLHQVLDLIQDRSTLNIEIKSDPEDKESAFEAAAQTIRCIGEHQAESKVLVSCFDFEVLRFIHKTAPHLSLGVLTYRNKEKYMEHCCEVGAFSWNPEFQNLTREEVETAQQSGLKVLPYTVNSESSMLRLFKMGVDGFFTDDPVLGIKNRPLRGIR